MKDRETISRGTTVKPGPPARLFRMYSDFCHQWKAERGPHNGPQLNVVLAYQDSPAGLHGFRVCRDLFEAVDQEFGFGFRNAWRFDFLRDPVVQEKAINESVCADMIVIAAHAPGHLPLAAKSWIDTVLAQRDGDPGALVLLLDEIAEKNRTTVFPLEAYLTERVQNGGMELFIKRAAASRPPGRRTTELDILEFRQCSKIEEVDDSGEKMTGFMGGLKSCPRILQPRNGRPPGLRFTN